MTPAAKLGGFGLVLGACVALGAAIGTAVGPIDTGGDAPSHEVPVHPVDGGHLGDGHREG